MQRVRKGDKVRVNSGKHRGQEGTVLQVLTDSQKAVVEGVNKAKIHQKAGQGKERGEIIQRELPLPLSKLALIDPKSKGMTTRVSYALNKDGKKVRRAKRSKADFSAK